MQLCISLTLELSGRFLLSVSFFAFLLLLVSFNLIFKLLGIEGLVQFVIYGKRILFFYFHLNGSFIILLFII